MHFLLMSVFAAVVAVVVAVVDPERHDTRGRFLYGLKVFGAFVGIGVALGWLMRFIPS
jgi:hypothetical protein